MPRFGTLLLAFMWCTFGVHAQTPAQSGNIPSTEASNIIYVDGVKYKTCAEAVTAAASSPALVVIPSNYAGDSCPAIPDNVAIQDYRVQGRLQIRVNPTTTPAGGPCGVNILIGPSPFSTTNPAPNDCVALYAAIQASAALPAVWAVNPLVLSQPGVTGNIYGDETDVNVMAPLDAGALGKDVISGGPAQATVMAAFRCQTANNGIPIGAWRTCLIVQGISDDVFFFAPKDAGLQITQAVTGSRSPQTVQTNGYCAAQPVVQLWVGTVVAVDAGDSQEDVTITDAGCKGTATITGIFAKTHAKPTNITEYYGKTIWNAAAVGPTKNIPYLWGNNQNFVNSNTRQVLGFGILDHLGTQRLTEYFDNLDRHIWRDAGTNGYRWQSQAASTTIAFSDTGVSPSAGVGWKHQRGALGCTTAASVGSTCTTAAINWAGPAFPDTQYTLTCTLETPSGVPVVSSVSKATGSFTITIAALTAVAATGHYNCDATHD